MWWLVFFRSSSHYPPCPPQMFGKVFAIYMITHHMSNFTEFRSDGHVHYMHFVFVKSKQALYISLFQGFKCRDHIITIILGGPVLCYHQAPQANSIFGILVSLFTWYIVIELEKEKRQITFYDTKIIF